MAPGAGRAARSKHPALPRRSKAYAELATVNAELAVLEQQKKAQQAIDGTVAKAVALPGEVPTARQRP